MRAPSEIVETEKDNVHCDGGGGALGHPRVFLTLGADGRVECPYCDRLFVKSSPRPAASRDQRQGEIG